MLRLFVGIEFPPELKLHLSLLETGIRGAKWVDAGNLHLTLRFIGEVDEGVAADIDEALAHVRARCFTLRLAGAGVFGGGTPRLLSSASAAPRDTRTVHRSLVDRGTPPSLRPAPRKLGP